MEISHNCKSNMRMCACACMCVDIFALEVIPDGKTEKVSSG